jgi:transcriptional regulator with XRE-family HTH domain
MARTDITQNDPRGPSLRALERLTMLLLGAHIEAAQLAVVAGLDAATLERFLTRRCVSLDAVDVLAIVRTLGCSADQLLGLAPDLPRPAVTRRCFEAARARLSGSATARTPPRAPKHAPRSVFITAAMATTDSPSPPPRPLRAEMIALQALPQRLRIALSSAGITQAEFARVARMNLAHVADILRGRRINVTVATLVTMAQTLRCETDWLLGLKDGGPTAASMRQRFGDMGGRVAPRDDDPPRDAQQPLRAALLEAAPAAGAPGPATG